MAVKSREYAIPALPAKSELGAHYYIPNGTGTNVTHYLGVSDGLFVEVGKGITSGGGGGGGADQIFNETPAGTMDAVNKTFTTANIFVARSTRLYLNGQRLKLGDDYLEIPTNKVVLVMAPHSTDNMIIDYQLT